MAAENLTLEEKIEKLIQGYKTLQDKYKAVAAEKDAAENLLSETKKVVATLEDTIRQAEGDKLAKDQEIAHLRNELKTASGKAEKFEQSSKTAAAKIDDILSQLTDL